LLLKSFISYTLLQIIILLLWLINGETSFVFDKTYCRFSKLACAFLVPAATSYLKGTFPKTPLNHPKYKAEHSACLRLTSLTKSI
jgi:hypothetical protein